jgi:hypothetical protein
MPNGQVKMNVTAAERDWDKFRAKAHLALSENARSN